MKTIKTMVSLLAALLLMGLTACMGSSEKTQLGPTGGGGSSDASVSTSAAVTQPFNQVVPDVTPPINPGGLLVPVQTTQSSIAFNGTVVGSVGTGGTIRRVVIAIDVDPTDAFPNPALDFVVLDTGTMATDFNNTAPGEVAAACTASLGAAAVFLGGSDSTINGLNYSTGPGQGACVGALIRPSGGTGRIWQSDGGVTLVDGGAPLATAVYRVEFLDANDLLVDSGTSRTVRQDPVNPLVAAIGRLSDIVVTTDTLAPAAITGTELVGTGIDSVPAAVALQNSGVLVTGLNLGPLPLAAPSWIEVNNDLNLNGGENFIAASERNLRASNVAAGDVVTVAGGGNLGVTRVLAPTSGVGALDVANASPSRITTTHYIASATSRTDYEVFHFGATRGREREDTAAALACTIAGDPGVTATCALDATASWGRASAVFLQGTATDASNDVTQLVFRANNLTLSQQTEETAVLFRDRTLATHDWAVIDAAVTAPILVVDQTAGPDPAAGGANNDMAIETVALGLAAGPAVSVVAGPPNNVIVDVDRLPAQTANWVIDAINIGTPDFDDVSSLGGETIRLYSVTNPGPGTRTITYQEATNNSGLVVTDTAPDTVAVELADASVVPPAAGTCGALPGPLVTPAAPGSIAIAFAGACQQTCVDLPGLYPAGTIGAAQCTVTGGACNNDISLTIDYSAGTIGGTCDTFNAAGDAVTVTAQNQITSTAAQVAAALNASSTLLNAIEPPAVAGTVEPSITALAIAAFGGQNTTLTVVGAVPLPQAMRASLFNNSDGTTAVAANATVPLSGGADTAADPTFLGRIASTNPKVSVGVIADIDPGVGVVNGCLPEFLNPADDVATTGVREDNIFRAICYAGQLAIDEGQSNFELDVGDAAGNQVLSQPFLDSGAVNPLQIRRDTAPAFFDTDANATPAGASAQPFFCEGGAAAVDEFTNEPVCVGPADVVTAGTAYQTFSNTVGIGGKVRDFIAGTTTFDTANAVDDTARYVYVRVTTDTGFDSFSLLSDGLTEPNPVPYVEGNGEDGDVVGVNALEIGAFNYTAIPVRTGAITNATVTLWDVAGNITSLAFTINQIAANTERAPSLAIDCFVGNTPRTAGVLTDCANDQDSANPNTPAHLRLGLFGDAPERTVAALTDGGLTYSNNFNTELDYSLGVAGSSFGVNYQPPLEQRLVAADKVSFRGRYLSLDSAPPTLLINNIGGQDVSLDIHGVGSVSHPTGFVDQIVTHTAGDNQFQLGALVNCPVDNVADERDNALRVGDFISLASLDPSQSANVGLYQIVSITPAAPCTISVDRPLPQDADTPFQMVVQAEYEWFTPTPLALPDEGINSFVFVAVDALTNQQSAAFSVVRDFQPPAIVIQGILDGFSAFSMAPEVFITDQSLFLGGVAEDSSGLANCLDPTAATVLGACVTTSPVSFIRVIRTDPDGFENTIAPPGTPLPGGFGYEVFGDVVDTCDIATGTACFFSSQPDSVALSYDAADTDADADPFSNALNFNATLSAPLGTGVTDGVFTAANAVVGNMATSTTLGQARAARLGDDPLVIRPDALQHDGSCVFKDPGPPPVISCPAGNPMSYRIEVEAADHVGLDANVIVNADIKEAPVDRLLSGALGILSTNPAAINLLTDSTELSILALDQLSLSGVTYNLNVGLSGLLGSPTDTLATNPQAFFYINNGSRDDFGILVGTVLQDPDGTGPGQSTAVTLMNVVRILADNGVLDDLLPILDNTNILNPRVNTAGLPRKGDMDRSQEFLRNLLVDTTPGLVTACQKVSVDASAQPALVAASPGCFTTEGIIKEAFPAIKASLDFGDILANPQAGSALRIKHIGAAGTTNSRLTAQGVAAVGGLDLAAVPNATEVSAVDFAPIDGAGLDCNTAPNDPECRSVVNVQPGDIIVIEGGVCAGVARRVLTYASNAAATVLPIDATNPFPASCQAACIAATPCDYSIVHPNGPSITPVIELVDTLAFGVPGNEYDNTTGGVADTLGGERELLSALFHLAIEEGFFNDPSAPYAPYNGTVYAPRSLVCPTANGVQGNATCAASTAPESIDDAESLQAMLDLLSELADDAGSADAAARGDPDGLANGREFISRAIDLVNTLLRNEVLGSQAPIPANASDTTFLESLMPLLTNLFDDAQQRKGNATADIGGLLSEPSVTNARVEPTSLDSGPAGPVGRQFTRLNLLLRSSWWLAWPTGTPVNIDLDGDGAFQGAPAGAAGETQGEYATDRTIIALLPLLRAMADDPDDNPRGIVRPGTNASGPIFQPPGSNPQRSILDRLLDPVDLILNDSRLPDLINQLGALLDPGTGISDFAAFDNRGPIDESPFDPAVTRLAANPFSVNPPLLRIISELSAATLDVNLTPLDLTDDESPTEALTRLLNVLLTPIGPERAVPTSRDVNKDNNNRPVNSAVCNEGFFAGRTPVEILLNVMSQLLEPAPKDPKDFDVADRTLPDATDFGGLSNRSLLRVILDGLLDDPAVPDLGGNSGVAANTNNAIDDYNDGVTINPCAGQNYDDLTCAGAGTTAQGVRGPNGGDGIAVSQAVLDILPELLNTMARFGFDLGDPAEPLTTIFENCTGATCPVNNGVTIAATDRLLANQRVGIDIALQLDDAFQLGSGANGFLRFEESATREAIEAISNLSNADAIAYLLNFVARAEEDIRPINRSTSIPNPDDVSRAAGAIRALADPDGDGDPSNDGVLDDLVPLIQVIPASGQTQQILDLLRAVRACGYDTSGGGLPVDIRGGEFLKVQEDTLLALLDANSGATSTLNTDLDNDTDPNTGNCPADSAGLPVLGRGGQGGILDSNPLFADGRTSSTLGTLLGGSRATGDSAASTFTDATKDFRALGAGIGADLCVVTSFQPFDEDCTVISAQPVAGIGNPITYTNATPDNINLTIDAQCPAATTTTDPADATVAGAAQAAALDNAIGTVVSPGSLSIVVADATCNETFVDNGDGSLTGSGGGTGTIDYDAATAPYALTMAVACTGAGTMTATYDTTVGGVGTAVVAESTGITTVALQLTYSSTLENTPVVPGSVVITSEEVFTDNGDGTLTGGAGGTGSIGYLTGAFTITHFAPPAGAFAVTANYSFIPGTCSYRVRMLREPFNGCRGGADIKTIGAANPGLGFSLSSFGVSGIAANGFRDSRMDLLLRGLDYLGDPGDPVALGADFPEGNAVADASPRGYNSMLDRLEALLKSAVTDNPNTGDQSIAKSMLFGPSGVQGSEEGPIQALFNDQPARAALTAFLTLFSQVAASPADPAGPLGTGVQDARDNYPDWVLAEQWPKNAGLPADPLFDTPCAVGTCNGNGLHDAVDYQFLALQGVLQVLGDRDGLDNGPIPTTGCDIFNRNAALNPDSFGPTAVIEAGHCDDPDVLFNVMSQFIEAGLISELIPGIQIITEATNALGIETPLDGGGFTLCPTVPTATPAGYLNVTCPLPAQRDFRLNVIRANEAQINRDALADIIQRTMQSATGDDVIFDFIDDQLFNGTFALGGPVYPQDYAPIDDLGGNLPNATSGILEGPQQVLVRALYGMMLEYIGEDSTAGVNPVGEVSDNLGYGTRRGRVVALEDLLARLSGARGSANLLNQALRILRGIAIDKDGNETTGASRSSTGFPLGETEGGVTGTTQRDMGPILSVNAGLAARNLVDPGSPFKSAMDVIGDFLNTLVEDPTDCNTATVGVIDRNAADAGQPIACPAREAVGFAAVFNQSEDVDSVFRDVGVTQERPIQPVFDEPVFDSLSGLFAGGSQATIVGALPFLGGFINEQLGFALQRNLTDFAEYDYCADITLGCTGLEDHIADALLADIQALVPGGNNTRPGNTAQLLRFDPLLTDDLNRNGLIGDGPLTGVGTSSPANDLDSACTGAIESDNLAVNCDQGNFNDGNPGNDWGDPLAPPCAVDIVAGPVRCAVGSQSIGFTVIDGVVTLGGLDGIDAALLDGIADLIAFEDPTRSVNNESNRTSTGREEDTFTFRLVCADPTASAQCLSADAVDPDFVSLLTALGDLLIQTNQ